MHTYIHTYIHTRKKQNILLNKVTEKASRSVRCSNQRSQVLENENRSPLPLNGDRGHVNGEDGHDVSRQAPFA